MPMLQCGRYECDDAEMISIMDGHPPPVDKRQRSAYFRVFEQRVEQTYGTRALEDMILFAGCSPPEYEDFSRERTKESTRKAGERMGRM